MNASEEAKRVSERFHILLAEIGELHDKKQADYGRGDDPFANVRAAEQWGLPPSLGACVRIGDKVSRLQTFYRKGELANESVEDAFMDLAVYALIGLLLYRQESGEQTDPTEFESETTAGPAGIPHLGSGYTGRGPFLASCVNCCRLVRGPFAHVAGFPSEGVPVRFSCQPLEHH